MANNFNFGSFFDSWLNGGTSSTKTAPAKAKRSLNRARAATRARGCFRFWDDLHADIKDVFTLSKSAPHVSGPSKFRPLVWVLGALGVAAAVVYPSLKDGVVIASHSGGDEHSGHHSGGAYAGFMDGVKGLFVRAAGFLGGAAVLTAITHGLTINNRWGRGAALLAKVVGIVGGGMLGAWAAIKSFPNKAAHIEHKVEEKHERKELFDTLGDKELGAVSFTTMPASKLVRSSAAMQDAYFAGMAKQTMDFTVNEKPLHTFFGVKTPFGDVPYDSGGVPEGDKPQEETHH